MIKAASVQFNHAPGDKDANLNTIKAFCEQASMEKVEILVFPEMCITGYWHVRDLGRTQLEALAEAVWVVNTKM